MSILLYIHLILAIAKLGCDMASKKIKHIQLKDSTDVDD